MAAGATCNELCVTCLVDGAVYCYDEGKTPTPYDAIPMTKRVSLVAAGAHYSAAIAGMFALLLALISS